MIFFLDYVELNPRLTSIPDFPPPTGEGGGWTPPSILAPVRRREKRRKAFESSSKMITKLFQSNFRSGQTCGLQRSKMPEIYSFSRLSNIVSENLYYLGSHYSYRESENVIRKQGLCSTQIFGVTRLWLMWQSRWFNSESAQRFTFLGWLNSDSTLIPHFLTWLSSGSTHLSRSWVTSDLMTHHI